MEKTKTILITGGAGFIGSNFLIYLFDKYPHYSFIVLDALTYAGDIKNIPERIHRSPRFRFVYGDVRNPKLVDHLVAQADIVVHFAAETHVARSIYDDTNFFETDVIGTQRVAYAVLHNRKTIDRFIHISTSEVYGTAVAEKMDEQHPLMPQSPYAAAKAGADRLVYSYCTTYKIPAVIIRPFNMFGPRQHLEKAIPRFVTSCILGEPITIHGTGMSSRDYTYVDDLVRAIDLVLHAPREKVVGEVFNVGTGTNPTMKEIADKVITRMSSGGKAKVEFSPYAVLVGDRPGQVFRHTADASKIAGLLGWKPKIGFDEGLTRTIAWFSDNQDWWRHKLWMRHVPIETEEGKIELH
ncbi:MAG: NAD-dependent epimerase/dehydratase [Microgenomates group bacterium GW2011_GWA1_48_10]|nr:MAG: NAD-dependent epimerase/dehydratase [Microgenomates group bacterium GW2011_GWA1_48_10]